MHYLKVLVAEASFHGQEALTYSFNHPLPMGTIVVVPLKKSQVLGIITEVTSRPVFSVKEILEVPSLPPLSTKYLQLLAWIHAYYPAPLGIITQLLLPHTLPKNIEEKHKKISGTEPSQSLPPLTNDQKQAVHAMNGTGLHLLHGKTGTGKTRVYIELARRELKKNRSSIILTPEIGLTSQLARDFQAAFGHGIVKIIHSKLSAATRSKLWVEILQTTNPLIVIGPRSALFSPLSNVGLIVVDESHETSYKQDQAPYYHASTIAAKLAELHGATLVLGSATPLVTDYYIATAKARPIIYMSQTASTSSAEKADTSVIDCRDRGLFSVSAYLSDELLEGIKQSLKNKEQSLVFLNRRGTARLVFCERCGWQAACPHCDLPLVYHGDSHVMRCHSCSYKGLAPSSCPDCGNPSIVFKGVGTKALADELQRLFPSVSIQRFDTDNKKSERIETHYDAIREGTVDILVGTQTLAKGLDLPKLSLVGIVNAESSLSFPDFSASERTYQLLAQVLGRIGRGHRATKAVIQSYSPDNPLLESAISKQWDVFYNKELSEREKFNFPPFCYLLKLTCRRATSRSAEQAADKLLGVLITKHGRRVTVDGPVACFREKVSNQYQWQLVVKSKRRKILIDIIHDLPNGWSYDIDPLNLL